VAGKEHLSPIVKAISGVERIANAEIRVHVSKRLFERDPFARAEFLFQKYGMQRTTHRNGVLLYLNLRTKKFAVVADEGIHKELGQQYWDELAKQLRDDLQSTYYENAIALTVLTIGVTMSKYFPAELN
jgi:uncharacterized membrane protein